MEKKGAVLVVGAGVAGIRASLDLAEAGIKVYLVDKSPNIGGTLQQLDKWFPDNHCEMCKMLPIFDRDQTSQFCLRRDLAHPNIELIPYSEVVGVAGEVGDFEVSLRVKSRKVDTERCTACGICAEVCPIEVRDEFNEGLGSRKAAYIRYPLAIPNVYTIDGENCNKCGECVVKCPTQAIDLSAEDQVRKLEVGAVILSTGFEEFDPQVMGQYGYGRYPNVVTSTEFERIISCGGPHAGGLVRPSDKKAPKRIAFLQCIGSRDLKRNYCSSACCMYALKEATLAKEQNPELDIDIYYMDLRAFGKGYYRYQQKAKDEYGVNFVRCRVPVVREDPQTHNLLVVARAEDGSQISSEFDMVVLSIGQTPSPRFQELGQLLGIEFNKWGFCQTEGLSQVETSKEGIYVCGSAAAPSDICDSLIQAGAAACQASTLLTSTRGQPVLEMASVGMSARADEDPKVAVFLCRCGEDIASVVDMEEMLGFVQGLPAVVYAEERPFLCLPETLSEVSRKIVEVGANRVIFGACAPYGRERLFREALKGIGMNTALGQMVDLREQVAWPHKNNSTGASEKAKALLAMALEKIKIQEPLLVDSYPVFPQALVLGGGIAGLTAALSIAQQGCEVHLVERSSELGGNLKEHYYTLENPDLASLLKDTVAEVEANPLIHVHTSTEVAGISGYGGRFVTTLKRAEEEPVTIEHGAIVLATGAEEYEPTEYLYGKNNKVITQTELEKRIALGQASGLSSVVMIQCVGSRDEERPYCSRVCCSQAIANALKIKEANPDAQVVVLYRDIMTYGFKEEYYTKAREAGVIFVRHDLENKPQVTLKGDKIEVRAYDPIMAETLSLEPDLLVLSTGIVPSDNAKIAQMLDLQLTEEGFFQEAEAKFRPVDLLTDGVYVCGLAHSPRSVEEVIAQAQAAAQRAVSLLRKGQLESGRIVSEVNERRCSACGICVDACPYNARYLDLEQGFAVVREALCQGCGVCASLCPNGAAKLRGFKETQMFAMIDVAL